MLRAYAEYGDAPLVIAHGDEALGAYLAPVCTERNASLVVIDGFDWERDLTPWPGALPRGGESTGGGSAHLKRLTDRLIPDACDAWGLRPRRLYIMGYSLAGLFALYAALESDLFHGAASASGSLWYPGFIEYARKKARWPEKVYLSLGDKEERSRNPLFGTVGANTRLTRDFAEAHDAEAVFVENRGGHFDHPDLRMRMALEWLLRPDAEN
ncbi:MAG: alpha/beta hydrolase [Clostridiales bacterium]|nr:alpha/beta hydrolase [Clostridiales bacterium]